MLVQFLSLIFLFAPGLFLQAEEEINFQPHMLDHQFPGCPTNSTCTEELGKKMNAWINELNKYKDMGAKSLAELNSYIQKNGMPMEFWIVPPKQDNAIISWDSHCFEHQKEGKEVDVGLAFVKEFSDASILKLAPSLKEHLLLETIFIKRQNKIERYFRPKGQNPMAMENNEVLYLQDLEGVYWTLHIGSKGELKVSAVRPLPVGDELSCPDDLIEHVKKNPPRKLIFESFYCKTLKDNKGQIVATAIIPYACE